MSTIVSSAVKQQGKEEAQETEHIENGDWVLTKWFFLKETFLYPVVVRKRKVKRNLNYILIKNYERIKE